MITAAKLEIVAESRGAGACVRIRHSVLYEHFRRGADVLWFGWEHVLGLARYYRELLPEVVCIQIRDEHGNLWNWDREPGG